MRKKKKIRHPANGVTLENKRINKKKTLIKKKMVDLVTSVNTIIMTTIKINKK